MSSIAEFLRCAQSASSGQVGGCALLPSHLFYWQSVTPRRYGIQYQDEAKDHKSCRRQPLWRDGQPPFRLLMFRDITFSRPVCALDTVESRFWAYSHYPHLALCDLYYVAVA